MADKIAALHDAATTLAQAARDLRPKVIMSEVRPGADRVRVETERSVLQTYETHAAALIRLASIPPHSLWSPEEQARRLETNVSLNMSAMAMCERRTQKIAPELAAPLHRAIWTLNAAFSPT